MELSLSLIFGVYITKINYILNKLILLYYYYDNMTIMNKILYLKAGISLKIPMV